MTVVTPHEMFAPRIAHELVMAPTMERFQRAKGRFQLFTGVDADAPLPDADMIVFIDKEAAPLALGTATWEQPPELHVVGDAREPGHLWAAIRSGNEAGRKV